MEKEPDSPLSHRAFRVINATKGVWGRGWGFGGKWAMGY